MLKSKVIAACTGFILILSSCQLFNRGEKLMFGLGEVYYKDGITQQEAEKFGNYLYQQHIFDESGSKVIQLVRKNDTATMRIVTSKEYINKASYQGNMRFLAAELSSTVFNNQPLNCELTNEYLNTEVKIPAFGRKLLIMDGNFYFSYRLGEQSAASLFRYMEDSLDFFAAVKGAVVLDKLNDEFVMQIMTSPEQMQERSTIYTYQLVAQQLAIKAMKTQSPRIRLDLLDRNYAVNKTYLFNEQGWSQ